MEKKEKKRKHYDVLIALGAIWLIVGLVIYDNTSLWPLGFIFLLTGLVGKFHKKKTEPAPKSTNNLKK